MHLELPVVAQQKRTQLESIRTQVWSLALLSRLRIWHCGVGRRHGLNPSLLWLWHRPAAAAPIRPLAWKLPYAAGAALKKEKKRKKHEEKITEMLLSVFIELSNPFSLWLRSHLLNLHWRCCHCGNWRSLSTEKMGTTSLLHCSFRSILPTTVYVISGGTEIQGSLQSTSSNSRYAVR